MLEGPLSSISSSKLSSGSVSVPNRKERERNCDLLELKSGDIDECKLSDLNGSITESPLMCLEQRVGISSWQQKQVNEIC